MSKGDEQALPLGWLVVPLSEIARINPALDRCVLNDHVEVTFVPMRAVEAEGGGLSSPEVRRFGEVKKGYTSFLSGDVIMAKITPCMENGKTTVVPDVPGQVCFGSTEFHTIRPERGVHAKWIAQFLLQHATRRAAQRQMTGGVGQMRVPASFLESVRIPLAPAAEQSRTTDALDELSSDLDAGVAALERAREKLKLYRASVLKAAVEGALTAEWRARHPHTEPASEPLERILYERHRRWEEDQLANYKAKGQDPPRNWKAKYKGPIAPDMAHLPPLAEGWCWATVDALGLVTKLAGFEYTKYVQYTAEGNLPVVKAENVTKNGFVEKEFSFVKSGAVEHLVRSRITQDDLLMVFVGVGVGQIGRVPSGREYFLGPNVALIRILCRHVSPAFVEYYLRSPDGLNRTLKLGKATAQGSISMGQIRTLPIAVPPPEEQEVIREIVDDQLSIVYHLESDLDAKLKTAQGLRQAILRDAFTGQLVPQDPNDEPVSELLKRIAAEREGRGAPISRRRRAVS